MRIGSLFSGAGGLDLAVEAVFGGRTVWHCEVDPAASKVLAYRWPGVPNLGDITAVDWRSAAPVDVLCGGFPCQDVSSAGRRAGIREGTRSGLWARYVDAIAALRPRFVVIENVRGLLTADGEAWPPQVVAADEEVDRLRRIERLIESKMVRAIREGNWSGEYRRRKQAESYRMARRGDRALARFGTLKRRLVQRAIGTVVADLASLGYDAQWSTVSAASVGAPHRRERVFILATNTARCGAADLKVGGDPTGQHVGSVTGASGGDSERSTSARIPVVGRTAAVVAALSGDGPVDLLPTPAASRTGNNQSASAGAAVRPSLDSITDLLPTPSVADGEGGHLTRSGARSGELLLPGVARAYGRGELLPTPNASDCTGGGQHPDRRDGHSRQLIDYALLHGTSQWGKYAPAINRWEALTRPAPAPTEPNTKGNPRLAAPFPEWMMGWTAGWCTAPEIGLSRNDALRIIGNGVCPQQAYVATSRLIGFVAEQVWAGAS